MQCRFEQVRSYVRVIVVVETVSQRYKHRAWKTPTESSRLHETQSPHVQLFTDLILLKMLRVPPKEGFQVLPLFITLLTRVFEYKAELFEVTALE